jgi:hypothetical protein
MRNGRNSCLFGEELVSYIYDELPTPERHSFENHLLNCSSCTSEFADLSMSRLGVYEWNRDEFIPLETPRFAIPYAMSDTRVSWLDAVRGFILTPARLSFAGGALALLVVAMGAFYVADSTTEGIADAQTQVPPIEKVLLEKVSDSVETPDEVVDAKLSTNSDLDRSMSKGESIPSKVVRKPTVVQARALKRSVNRQLTARGNRPVKAPRLGSFEEVEDTSLRLADLVADIDSYRK